MKPVRRISFEELDDFIDRKFPNTIFHKLPLNVKEEWWACMPNVDNFIDLKYFPEETQKTYERIIKFLEKYKEDINKLKLKQDN